MTQEQLRADLNWLRLAGIEDRLRSVGAQDALTRILAIVEPLAGLSDEQVRALLYAADSVMSWHDSDGGKGSPAETYRRLAAFATRMLGGGR